MSTIKFDNIAVEFLKRAKGEFKTSFTPGGGVMPDADFLTAEQIVSYVNKALQTFFSEAWVKVESNAALFSQALPELVRIIDVTFDVNGEYTIANPNLDYQTLVSGIVNGKLALIAGSAVKQEVASGRIPQFSGSSEEPIVIEADNVITVYPIVTFKSTQGLLTIIQEPIDPTTGTLLSQDGDYDSPFKEIWLNDIAQIAFNEYLKDSTVQS